MEQSVSSEIPWMQDDFPTNVVTNLNNDNTIMDKSNEIGTIIIFVISAVLMITLLFALAIFIDCRQQKLTNLNTTLKAKRKFKVKVLKLGRQQQADDEGGFADKMEQNVETETVIV